MNLISFMSANYVARPVGYHMTDWGHGDRATNEYFSPIETYAQRLGEILQDIRALGFEAVDLWLSHLNYTWATEKHLAIARDQLAENQLKVASIAGWLGSTSEEFERACQIATAMGTNVLGSTTSMLRKDRPFVVATLKRYGLKLGIENHPEKTPQEVLAQIGKDGEGTLGACVDTGWFGTQGYNAARALEELGENVIHVHLKDVLSEGTHESCRFGKGIVPVEDCVRVLQKIGYAGAISIEHEPEHFDPTEDVRASARMVSQWLKTI